jgi:hypothetical protein
MSNVYNVQNTDLTYFGPSRWNYDRKNIRLEAVQVTAQNIGKLALEFEAEIWYTESGNPFFHFRAQRMPEGLAEGAEPEKPLFRHLTVFVTDWIVPLRGELHVYRDFTFQNTFDPDDYDGVTDMQAQVMGGLHSAGPLNDLGELSGSLENKQV